MKKITKKYLPLLFLVLTSTGASAKIGGVIEGDFTIYDIAGAYSYGQQFGFSYKTDKATHYFLGSAQYLEQEDSADTMGPNFDVDSMGFGFAYRYGFSVSDDFQPYIEYGWNNFSSSYKTIDPLGNPTTLESDNRGDYLAVGVLYRLWKDLHLKAEIGYYGIFAKQNLSTPIADSLGNKYLVQDKISLSSSIGISFKF